VNKLNATILKIAGAASLLMAVATPAAARDWRDDRYGYSHGDRSYEWDRHGRLRGKGVGRLDPYLRETWQGRQFVVRVLGSGYVSKQGARIANREFYRSAHRERRFGRHDFRDG
jgi:hypothetical protein